MRGQERRGAWQRHGEGVEHGCRPWAATPGDSSGLASALQPPAEGLHVTSFRGSGPARPHPGPGMFPVSPPGLGHQPPRARGTGTHVPGSGFQGLLGLFPVPFKSFLNFCFLSPRSRRGTKVQRNAPRNMHSTETHSQVQTSKRGGSSSDPESSRVISVAAASRGGKGSLNTLLSVHVGPAPLPWVLKAQFNPSLLTHNILICLFNMLCSV